MTAVLGSRDSLDLEARAIMNSRREHRLSALLLALFAVAACRAGEAPPPRPLDAVLAGCDAGSTWARCLVTRGSTLSVWLPISAHEVVAVSGPATPIDHAARDTGVLHRFAITRPDGTLRIDAKTGTITRTLELALAPAVTDTSTRAEESQAAALTAAREALRGGDTAKALELLTRAERGDPFHARRAAMLGAYVAAVMVGDHVDAERRLARMVPSSNLDGEGTALADFHRGLILSMTGDRRAALEALEPARRMATRLDLELLAQVRELEAVQLLEIGRADEAVAILEALATKADTMRRWPRADLLNNLASARIRAGTNLERARRELERALADYTSAEALVDANNARVTLAALELEAGDLTAAKRTLEAVGGGPELPITAAWRRLVTARIHLASGALARACEDYRRLAEDARRVLWWSIEAQAELGLGACLEAQSRDTLAMKAYERARAALDESGTAIPIDRGTLERMDGRAELEARVVRLWLELGAPDRAFREARASRLQSIARIARARAHESLSPAAREQWLEALAKYRVAREALDRAALERWQSTTADAPRVEAELQRLRTEVSVRLRELLGVTAAPAPEIPEIARGELRLLSLPIDARTVTFAGTHDRVLATWDPRTLAAEVAAAGRLRVIATPSPALARLLGSRPWAYTTDLPSAPHTIETRRALVVADPRGDLPHARREGQEVVAALRAQGWEVETLFGAEARRDALERALSRISLFHYAGHGRDRPERRWDGALLLAEGELEVSDIVATSTVPPFVVLSGCETAALEHGDLTLAQAFAIAGAEAVVATSTVVDDAVARDFARSLYAAPAESWSLVEAYTEASRVEGVFRLLVR